VIYSAAHSHSGDVMSFAVFDVRVTAFTINVCIK